MYRPYARSVVAVLLLASCMLFHPFAVPRAQADASAVWSPESEPEIFGTPRVGERIGANQGLWSPSPDHVTFTWLRDGTEVLESEEYSTYVIQPEDFGHKLSARVTVISSDRGTGTATTAQIGPVNNDRPLYAPTDGPIGLPHPGHQLDANPGQWVTDDYSVVPDVTFTYQWSRSRPNEDGTMEKIANATERFYTPTLDDLGWSISAVIEGRKDGYFSYPAPRNVGVIVEQVQNHAAPSITGETTVGSVLIGSPGVWTPAVESEFFRLSYQWLRDGKNIAGATSSSYLLRSEDAGRHITLSVTGQAYGYYQHNATAWSAPTVVIQDPPAIQPDPVVQPPADQPPSQRQEFVVHLAGKSDRRGKVTLKVRITPRRARASVTIFDGPKPIRRSVKLKDGRAKITLSKLKKGRHTFKVLYRHQHATVISNRVRIRVR